MSDLPLNLVHIALAHEDRTMLTSPDGKRVEVNLSAIAAVLGKPPAMFPVDPELSRLRAENERLTGELAATVRKFNCDTPEEFWSRVAKLRARAEIAEAARDTATLALSDLRARIAEPDEAMVALVRDAARDEYGSALCAWIDMKTQRACAINVLPYKCRCEAVGRAVLYALSQALTADKEG